MPNWPEAAIVRRIVAGEGEAFRELVEKYQNLVSHIVFQLVAKGPDREELCQEVFIKAYRNLPGFRFQSRLSTWLGRIAYNTCLNYLKKKSHDRRRLGGAAADLTDNGKDISERLADRGGRPDELLERHELAEFLQHEISQLTPAQQTIVTLFHGEGLSLDEIAQITSLPEGTVKSHLFRARQALKRSLLKIYEPEETAL